MRGIFPGCKAAFVILVTRDVINNWREPGVVGGIELLSLEIVKIDSAQAFQLTLACWAANLGCYNIKSLVHWSYGGT